MAKAKQSKQKISLGTICLILLVAGLLFFGVQSRIQQNEKNATLTKLTNELKSVNEDGMRLEIEIEKRSDYFTVEKYASEKLNMQKLENYQVQYVVNKVYSGAELLNEEPNENFASRITKTFSVLSELFGK